MRRVLPPVFVVLAVAAALAIAWEVLSGDAAARANFAGHVDQLCSEYHDDISALGQPSGMADLPRWARTARPYAVTLAGELDAIRPPADERDRYAVFRGIVRRQIELLDEQRDAALAHSSTRFKAAARTSHALHAREKTVATSLGLFICGH